MSELVVPARATPSMDSARSTALFERALKVMPGGNTRHSVFFAPHPLYAAKGVGARLTDADGVERLDFVNNYSSLIHGHGEPSVLRAVREQAERLLSVGLPTQAEVELAELLCQRIDSVERVRFMNSGTEAVMFAVKVARAATGRAKIAKFEGCYHGTYDPVEVSQAPDESAWGRDEAPSSVALTRGTPRGILDDTLVLPFNDVDASRRILEANAEAVACILVDVTPAHLGYLEMSPEMLAMLRAFCDKAGALLVADEVYSLRLDYGGAQRKYGFRPDLTVMGKIIGGGLPIGAVGGSVRIMSMFDFAPTGPVVAHGGTYNANPLSMVAGLASMRALTTAQIQRMHELGAFMRAELKRLTRAQGFEMLVGGVGSLISMTFGRGPIRNYRDRAHLGEHRAKILEFHRLMLDNGVYIASQGLAVLSTPMGEAEASEFLAAASVALRRMG